MYTNISDLDGCTIKDILDLDELQNGEGYLWVYNRKHMCIRVQEGTNDLVIFQHVDADWIAERIGRRITVDEARNAANEGRTFSGLEVFETIISDNDDSFEFEIYLDPTPYLNETVENFFLHGKGSRALDALTASLLALPTGSDYFNL